MCVKRIWNLIFVTAIDFQQQSVLFAPIIEKFKALQQQLDDKDSKIALLNSEIGKIDGEKKAVMLHLKEEIIAKDTAISRRKKESINTLIAELQDRLNHEISNLNDEISANNAENLKLKERASPNDAIRVKFRKRFAIEIMRYWN